LKQVGIDHILTTLHSCHPETHDYMADTAGAFDKIVQGIQVAQHYGIRVTVNTILFDMNKNDIFDTGEFCKSIGVTKFLANRTIPSPANKNSLGQEFMVSMEHAQKMFDDLLRLKELGMEVGTCRMVPECFFDDHEKYKDFIGRGCAAGKRHMMINVNGDTHACVHESFSYGNIHRDGLKSCWEAMGSWRDATYVPEDCKECPLLSSCEGGCRMVGLACTGSMNGKDNLCKGLRFRREDGFSIIPIRGAKVRYVDD